MQSGRTGGDLFSNADTKLALPSQVDLFPVDPAALPVSERFVGIGKRLICQCHLHAEVNEFGVLCPRCSQEKL
jgi:hypothetical protein